MEDVALRASTLLSEYRTIVWEADAGSLECTYIGASAVPLLGYARTDWTGRAGFWAETIHPDDRDEATGNCALCAGRGRGHNFSYRAVSADGEIRHFYNVVRVLRGPRGMAVYLRGILFDVTDDTGALDSGPLAGIRVQAPEEAIEI